MPTPLIPVQTIQYKQYIKRTLVSALNTIFRAHPDPILKETRAGIDFNPKQVTYPFIIVRFLERELRNAGIHHYEMILNEETGRYQKYKHYFFSGSVEFAVYALSPLDRDLVSDALVQILTMGELEPYSTAILDAIYSADFTLDPLAVSTMINLNTDVIQGFGETQGPVPWTDEDDLVYQTSYRLDAWGEVYSRIQPDKDYGLVEKVEVYPYRSVGPPEPVPNPNPEDPNPWQ